MRDAGKEVRAIGTGPRDVVRGVAEAIGAGVAETVGGVLQGEPTLGEPVVMGRIASPPEVPVVMGGVAPHDVTTEPPPVTGRAIAPRMGKPAMPGR